MNTILYNGPVFALLIFLGGFLAASCADDGSVTDRRRITGVNAYFSSEDAKKGKKRTLETTIKVDISHRKHEKAGVSCRQCHHKGGNDERVKVCSYCHRGLAGARMFHSFCVTCHTRKNTGPKHCNECHVEKKEREKYDDIRKMYAGTFSFASGTHAVHKSAGVDCDTCHHDSGRDRHEKKKKCTVCHVGKTKMVILHSFCKDCHKKRSGPVHCQECHAGKNVTTLSKKIGDVILLDKTGHRLPQIRFTHKSHIEKYNTECIDCHHLGSTKKCSACHKKKDEGAVVNLKGAFHQQCHQCHLQKGGPKGCQKCHRAGN